MLIAVGPATSQDARFAGMTGADISVTLQAPLPTSTALDISSPALEVGDEITLTATVAGGDVSGDVEFFDGTTTLGRLALVNGTAALTTAQLAVGVHELTAAYLGDVSYAASRSGVAAVTVAPEPTPEPTAEPTPEPTLEPEPTAEPTPMPSTVAPTQQPTPDSAQQEELAHTGSVPLLGLGVLGAIVLAGGAALTGWRRAQG